MAERSFGGSRYWVWGAVWWFVVGGALGLVHRVFPGLEVTPKFIFLAVVAAVVGGFIIVWLIRPRP